MTDWSGFCRQLNRLGERRLLVLSGDVHWAQAQAQYLLAHCGEHSHLWLGAAPADQPHSPMGKYHSALGREYSLLVFNAFSGLHPDALGAAGGALAAGGILLLLCPPLEHWPESGCPDLRRYVALPEQADHLYSHFIARFVRLLQANADVLIHRQGQAFSLPALRQGARWQCRPDRNGCLNPQQRHALAVMLHCARQQIPVVLTADRGRGKSSLLGRVAERWLQAGKEVVLTAPSPGAAAQAQTHCSRLLPFTAPDALLQTKPDADLVLVDEAAAIPVPMLLALARQYTCVFASTEHGYEGTGLGFALKFQPALAALFPRWRKLHLDIPARWSVSDPLEPLLFTLLALNAEPPAPATTGELSIRPLSRKALLHNDTLLEQLFGLLTLAHYQTRPGDLRQLLDAPGVTVVAAFRGEIPVAAVLVIREGEMEPQLASAIWRGQRRPRGHLLPQSLAFHGGHDDACRFRYDRIMRIVVHPACQGMGIGSRLLDWLKQHTSSDFLGTSFGASPELMAFWQQNQFVLVRRGLSADGVSGLQAAMMLWPASSQARAMLPIWQQQFMADHQPKSTDTVLPQDGQRAHDLAFYHRDWHADCPALRRFVTHTLPRTPLTGFQQQLLQAALQPGAEPAKLASRFGYSGHKSVISALRRIMQCYF
ncbi:tRNA(Met) cytidine acetyltransferase TmcA [Oceanimonas smirnovii]|uniref:tRNA(Met) cytidine acetyltransferase TmcA n=1 Tax=Oceanimonas smirnovii TaxID=264574 RepID=A0ABW7P245_9GAMM